MLLRSWHRLEQLFEGTLSMRTIVAAALAASFLATPVFAGDLPLPAGKPAGVTNAQYYYYHTVLSVIRGGAIIAGIVILASNSGSNGALTPGTTPASSTTT